MDSIRVTDVHCDRKSIFYGDSYFQCHAVEDVYLHRQPITNAIVDDKPYTFCDENKDH